ncbi:MAG: helix-turn-helix domain-containing protein [Tannerellaceae bacterium]|nr:helix-turn-helix domain-containing protein [Tannerellaceae bacterium]
MRPQLLTFESIKESIRQKTTEKNRIYFGKDFIIVTNNNHLLSHMLLKANPVTLHYTMLGFVSTGEAVFTVNLLEHYLSRGNIIILNRETIYQLEECSDNFTFNILILSDELIGILFPEKEPEILGRLSEAVLPLHAAEMDIALSLIDTILKILDVHINNEPAVYDLIRAIIRFADGIRRSVNEREEHTHSHEQEIFNSFLKLVNMHASKERGISFYADNLCITRNYLSVIVSRVSGVTAKRWIERAVIMEAKVLLKFSTLTILEIADKLHFPNDSFFNKYFKRIVGVTPMHYRKSKP